MSEQNHQQPLHTNSKGGPNGQNQYFGEHYRGETIPKKNTQSDEIDLGHLFRMLFRYKWWVLSITIIATAAAGFIAYTMQPTFQSSGTMMIADQRNQHSWAGTDLSSMMSSSFGVGTASRLINEMQVLQSRNVADEMAQRLIEEEFMENGERFPILWMDYPEDSTMATRGMVASRLQHNMEVNRVDRDTDVLRISYNSYSPFEAKRLVDLTMDTYSDVSAQQKRVSANAAINFLEQEMAEVEQNLQTSEERLRDYMSTTNLVQVDGQTEAAIQRTAELESQLQQVQVQRVSITSSIESYQSQLDQIRPGLAEQLSENISTRLERAQFRLAELRTERALLLQRNPQLRENPEMEPQIVQMDEEIEALRNEIRDITNNLMDADDSDVYIGFLDSEDGGVSGRIIELRRSLIEKRIEESQLNAQEEAITQRLAEEELFFDGLPENMLELARMRRDVKINEQLYTSISSQYQETQLWEQTQYGSGRVIDQGSMPDRPASPNQKLYLLIGFVIGGVMSIGFVLTKETVNKSVDGTEKLRQLGFPVLAVIPNFTDYVKEKYKSKEYVTLQDKKVSTSWTCLLDSISPISESYRRLQNNIIYADPDKNYQTILVTSSRKGEGKTTISINLAVSLAESGKKVLLIDTDLRRPNLHRCTGESREPGIAEIFYDDKSKASAIKPTLAPGLHIITAGRSIPNPSAVMQSEKLRNFLDGLKEKYDHIIVDTPPYGVITDAAPMMQRADGIILVAKFGETQMNEITHTVENLKRIRANVIGTVLTAYRHKKSADYYYYNEYTYDSYKAYEEYQETS